MLSNLIVKLTVMSLIKTLQKIRDTKQNLFQRRAVKKIKLDKKTLFLFSRSANLDREITNNLQNNNYRMSETPKFKILSHHYILYHMSNNYSRKKDK